METAARLVGIYNHRRDQCRSAGQLLYESVDADFPERRVHKDFSDGPTEVFLFAFAIGTISGLIVSVIAILFYLPAVMEL